MIFLLHFLIQLASVFDYFCMDVHEGNWFVIFFVESLWGLRVNCGLIKRIGFCFFCFCFYFVEYSANKKNLRSIIINYSLKLNNSALKLLFVLLILYILLLCFYFIDSSQMFGYLVSPTTFENYFFLLF